MPHEDTLDMLEIQTRDSVIERRNFFLGLWAGRLLGHDGDDLALYAGKVMASDLEEPGSDDIVRCISADLAARGLPLGQRDVIAQLRQTERLVRCELLPTD